MSEFFTEEKRDGSLTLLLQCDLERTGDGVFSGVVETGQEDSEALLGSRRVGFSKDLYNASV